MAPKAAKRSAQEKKGAAPKKAKVDPMVGAVEDAIKLADPPENCRNMLLAGIADGLGTPSDLRHEHQHLAVKLIGEAIEGVQTKLQEAVDAENANMVDADATKAKFESQVTDAEAILASAVEKVGAKQKELADISKVMFQKRSTLLSANAAQSQAEGPLTKARAQKEQHEAANQDHLQPLMSQELDATQATAHYQCLSALIVGLDLEESFKQALPGSCGKKSTERTQFDCMVLKELENRFNEQIVKLGKTIEEGEPESAELAKAVVAAEEEHNAAKADHQTATNELTTLQTEKQEFEASLKAAQQAMADNEKEHKSLSAGREQKQEELDNFKNWNVECFNVLRDRVSKKPVIAEAATETPDATMSTQTETEKTVAPEVVTAEVVSTGGA